MEERLRFVARLLDGEKTSVVCRYFGISRKTGYKIFNRYKDSGIFRNKFCAGRRGGRDWVAVSSAAADIPFLFFFKKGE
jgi:transposase